MWSTPVDLYCERTDPSFWAEPVNALSNAAFLIAAALAYRDWWRRSDDTVTLLLIVVTVLVGFGSFAFRTLATTCCCAPRWRNGRAPGPIGPRGKRELIA